MNKTSRALAIAIFIIVALGAFLRFYQLDTLVPILNRDEAALGYNVLLLSQVGMDEWGEPWNFSLRSFGDYKLVGYPALLVGLIQIIDADDVWVRLPSALAGIGIVLISFPLARVFKLSKIFSLLFMLVIALAPFAIYYSRFAYEANVALFYVLLAFWLLFKPTAKVVTLNSFQGPIGKIGMYLSMRKRLIFDILGIGLLVLACFTYNSPLILFLPIVLIVVISRIKDGWKSWLPLMLMGMIAWIGVVWAIYPVITQKSGISLMTDPLVTSQYSEYRQNLPNIVKPLIGSQYAYWAYRATNNAFKSISTEFLLTKIFHPWHGVPGRGQLLWPVVVVGWLSLVWLLVRVLIDLMKSIKIHIQHDGQKTRFILLSLTLVSLLPAIITVDAPHATRSLLFLYLFCLISIWGVEQLLFVINQFIDKKQTQKTIHYLLPIIVAILVIASASMYIQDLFGRYRIEAKSIFQAGIVEVIEQLPDEGQVAVIDPDGYEYIRWAWYGQISPKEFLSTIVRRSPSVAGLRYGEQVGRFRFIDQASNRQVSDVNLVQWNKTKSSWEVLP